MLRQAEWLLTSCLTSWGWGVWPWRGPSTHQWAAAALGLLSAGPGKESEAGGGPKQAAHGGYFPPDHPGTAHPAEPLPPGEGGHSLPVVARQHVRVSGRHDSKSVPLTAAPPPPRERRDERL